MPAGLVWNDYKHFMYISFFLCARLVTKLLFSLGFWSIIICSIINLFFSSVCLSQAEQFHRAELLFSVNEET